MPPLSSPIAPTNAPRPKYFVLVLVLAQMAIGSAALFVRYGLADSSPLALSAWRLTIATIIVLLTSVRAEKITLTKPEKQRLILAGICLGVHFAAWFISLQTLSVGRSTLLVSTAPLWTGLASILFFREKLSARFWWGLLLAGIGLVAFVGDKTLFAFQRGDLLAILGAIAITAYLLLVKPVQERVGTMTTVCWTYASAAVALWLAVGMSRTDPLPQTLGAWGAIAGLALVPQLIGHTTMNAALRYVSPAVISASTLLEPVIAALLAWVFLREHLTLVQIVGGVVVLLGMGLTLSLSPAQKLSPAETRERDALNEVALREEK
jgi:drug/metabolite transporter (DMT)-like permease